MPKGITKTQRILVIFHLFRHCEEVSFQEIFSLVSGCKKTFSRDIALLRMAGIGIRYSAKRRAFIEDYDNFVPPELPEGKSERRYIIKLRRLTKMMREMDWQDCDKWYMDNIPGATRRTMQRDFATLNSIGYEIGYKRSEYFGPGSDQDVPLGHYYYEEPNDAYGLVIS